MAPHGDPDAPVVPVATRGRRMDKGAIFRALAIPAAPLFDLMAKIEVVDGQKLPASGSFVLTPNHITNIDPVVVGRVMYGLGRLPRFMAKASLFRVPVFGRLMHAMGHIPVERAGRTHDSDPLAAARRLTSVGGGVIVYPEGTLTRDPDLWPMKGKSGAVRLALAAGVPLVPVAHWGSQELMGRYSSKLRPFPRKRIRVIVGDPVDLSAYRDRPLDQASMTEATALVMAAITGLLERLRDEQAPVERWNPAKNDQKETGRFE
ncbi:lysophospholipid acyltransferase family protein [Frigoribacterium sp. CFBP9039]|uniref:lysophospholipid acyltransferase family protein n=1 Tax=Frigoribacterium TaxID=96492 RepID=UPI001FAE3CEA|nr:MULTISPECIES: lysophospholipid acyltransferase family protein [Frigoribacterium]MCJ0701656.1 1-acyl-sn-glycerol-3-phosphate acyltransferase [Frigoribacterium faeni]MDY0891314.1 lysophospholipid acyltransferase family protein [Frigoribacterium sp. CFBP9030]MDY0944385.1 lysophospholipid acyltransferase family protein [Frigoribacterium sp. CFBP9039]